MGPQYTKDVKKLEDRQRIFLGYYDKFAVLYSQANQPAFVDMYSTQPGIIVYTITKGLSHSTARVEPRDNATLHLYQLGSCDALTCPDWV